MARLASKGSDGGRLERLLFVSGQSIRCVPRHTLAKLQRSRAACRLSHRDFACGLVEHLGGDGDKDVRAHDFVFSQFS